MLAIVFFYHPCGAGIGCQSALVLVEGELLNCELSAQGLQGCLLSLVVQGNSWTVTENEVCRCGAPGAVFDLCKFAYVEKQMQSIPIRPAILDHSAASV